MHGERFGTLCGMIRIACAIVLVFCAPLFGWGGKEHVQLTRIAARQLADDPATPADMKAWLTHIIPEQRDPAGERDFFLNATVGIDVNRSGGGVLYWVMVPDEVAQNAPRDAKIEPFGVHERLMHYIDLELFVVGNKQRKFAADLSAKPEPHHIRRDWRDERYIQAGYLPFAVENSYQKLVQAIREGRLLPEQGNGGRDDDSAMRWAGYLAHYLQDNTQPHHSTIDFKSRSYFQDRRDAPDIHREMEWRMGDDARENFPELRAEYWSAFSKALREFEDPIKQSDPWLASVEVSFMSYDFLPLIGEAAVAAATRNDDRSWTFDTTQFFHHTGEVGGARMSVLEMKARQQAWAVKRTSAMWLAAWREARGLK